MGAANALLHYPEQTRLGDDPTFADLARLQFKLRFDQHQHPAAGFQQRHRRRQNQGLRNKRQIANHQVECAVLRACREPRKRKRRNNIFHAKPTRIDVFEAGHPSVMAQPLMQLAEPDIDSNNMRCTALQQAVGKATG